MQHKVLDLLIADTDGDLCIVPPWDLDNWTEAILVTRDMVNALDGPGRATLEVYVDGELLIVACTCASVLTSGLWL